jgi:tetratricopeptide (TPR) repeat protein
MRWASSCTRCSAAARPYGETLNQRQAERAVLEIEPPRPSRSLATLQGLKPGAEVLAELRGLKLKTLRSSLRGDLDVIVGRAIKKTPAERYASVLELRADLQRYLDHLPIAARRDRLRYRAGKFVRRNRMAVAAALLVSLAGIAGLIGTLWQARLAIAAERSERAQKELVLAREAELSQVVQFQSEILKGIDVQQFGYGWLDGMRRNIESELEQDQQLTPTERTALLSSFDKLRLRAKPTELARQTLSRYMLTPADREVERMPAGSGSQSALRLSLADAYAALGLYADASREAERAAAANRQQYGSDDDRTLRAELMRARMKMQLGSFDAARGIAQAASDTWLRSSGGIATRDTVEANWIIASLMAEQSHFTDAESLLRKTIADADSLGLARTRLATQVQAMLGATLASLGRYAESETLLRKVYLLQKQQFGDDDPDTMFTEARLADALTYLSKNDQAAVFLGQLIASANRRLGEDHPETLGYLSNLANNLADRGQMDAAGKIEDRILAAQRLQLGPDHPETLRTMNNHAVTLQSLGKLDEALSLRRQVLDTRIRVLGPDNVASLYARNNLGVSLRESGDYAASLVELRRAYADYVRVLGAAHPRSAEVHLELAMSLLKTGDLPAGRREGLAALAEYGQALGPTDTSTLSSTNDLSKLLYEQGDHGTARELSRHALELARNTPSESQAELVARLQATVDSQQAR